MAFEYAPPGPAALRQGELLENIWWHCPRWPATQIPEGAKVEIQPVHHPLVVVLHQDCDLERDYNLRAAAKAAGQEPDPESARLIAQVLCCDAFTEDQMRIRAQGVTFQRVKDNQVERFHCLPAVPAGRRGEGPEVYFDFCGVFSVFTAAIYEAIEAGSVGRRGLVPPVYLHDLIHRVFGFLSRVALPE